VLAYLARYTHRIAISNRRLIRSDADGVTFTYKDYRVLPAVWISLNSSGLNFPLARACRRC